METLTINLIREQERKKTLEYQFGFRLKDFTRHNKYLSDNLEKQGLFKYHYETASIDVDLDLFNDKYKSKFIAPDLHRYCVGLLNKLQLDIFGLIQFNKIKSYTITYDFHLAGTSHTLKVKYGLTQQFV